MTDIDRLKILRKSLNIQQGHFAESLNLKQGSYSDIERGRSGITYNLLQLLIEKYKVNPLWIISGEEPMIISDYLAGNVKAELLSENGMPNSMPDSMPNAINEPNSKYGGHPLVITIDTLGQENIIFVDVKAAAGYVSHRLEPTFIRNLPAYSFPGSQFHNGSFRMFEIEGDSMQDTLFRGDYVVGKYLDHHFQSIKDGYVHIIVTREDVLIKRVLNRVLQRGKIVLQSDNDSYPTVEIDASEVLEIWYVVKVFTGNLPARNKDLKKIIYRLQEDYFTLAGRVERLESKPPTE